MTKSELKKVFIERPSYFKKGKLWLSQQLGASVEDIIKVFDELKKENKEYRELTLSGSKKKRQVVTYLDKIKDRHPNVITTLEEPKEKNNKKIVSYKGNPENVLFIGDLHAPFILDGYLEFNVELQKKYDCGTVIFAGDIIDRTLMVISYS